MPTEPSECAMGVLYKEIKSFFAAIASYFYGRSSPNVENSVLQIEKMFGNGSHRAKECIL